MKLYKDKSPIDLKGVLGIQIQEKSYFPTPVLREILYSYAKLNTDRTELNSYLVDKRMASCNCIQCHPSWKSLHGSID